MSQQEFDPGSQSNQQDSLNEDNQIHQPQYPYSWSGQLNQEGGPRDEPLSDYDAAIMQQRYGAQTPGNAHPQSLPPPPPGTSYTPPSGDAYGQGYRPYNSYNAWQGNQGVPSWARPQRQRRGPVGFGFIILVLIIIGLFGGLFHGGLAFIFSTIFGLVMFAILLPLIVVLIILASIMRMFRPRRVRYWRRGPWWF